MDYDENSTDKDSLGNDPKKCRMISFLPVLLC